MYQQKYNPISGNFDLVNITKLEGLVTEDFVYPNGDKITFTANFLNGGNSTVVTNGVVATSNMNNAAVNYARTGVHGITISNASANAFASLQNTSLINAPRYMFLPQSELYTDVIWRMVTTPIIDFANDPVLACVGYLSFLSTATVNPLLGTYFRLPRVGETSFVKYVVRIAGAETIFDTGIAITSNNTGYIKTAMSWDGANDTMTYYATDGTTVWSGDIVSFLATYPSLSGAGLHFCGFMARNGDGAVKQQTLLHIDSVSRWIPTNYSDF